MRKLLILPLVITSAMFILGLLVTTVSADIQTQSQREQAMEHKFEKAKQYYAECKNVSDQDFEDIRPYLKAFTDIEVMADTMANPVQFAKFIQVINDPRTMHVMMKCSTEPVMWDTWVRGLSDPAKMMNAAMRFMNPMVYFNWAMAPMNPEMYAPMTVMMSPQYYEKWATAMANPAFYNPFFAMMDPNWYTPRLEWMMNPESYAPMFGMMNITPYVADVTTVE